MSDEKSKWEKKDRGSSWSAYKESESRFEVIGGDKGSSTHGHAVYEKGESLGMSVKDFEGRDFEIREMREKYVRTKNGKVVKDE